MAEPASNETEDDFFPDEDVYAPPRPKRILHSEVVEFQLPRRQALLERAPSKERIKALMDSLPPCDEWLDDKYD